MINFYPGPSKLDERIPNWINEGLESGIISANHRSDEFMLQYQELLDLFREIFEIPDNYALYFTSSATECWFIIGESFRSKKFEHFSNGAFGDKWYKSNKNLGLNSSLNSFDINEKPDLGKLDEKSEVLCFTHNETSNGSRLSHDTLLEIDNLSKDHIIAIDATSSMGGDVLPWAIGDIWFASVQKCFGLPAGMGIMIVNKKIINMCDSARTYNHIEKLHSNFEKYQTTHTPNTLNIYLIWQLLQNHIGMNLMAERIQKRAWELYYKFDQFLDFDLLIKNSDCRSNTVLTIKCAENKLPKLLKFMDDREIILGKGYGEWKNSTFRIANFPSHKQEEFDFLFQQINKWQRAI